MCINMPRKVVKSRRIRRKPTKRAKAMKNQDTFSLITRSRATLVPSQGALVSNYIYIFGKLIDNDAAIGVLKNAEYRVFQNLYDQVRINKVVLKVKPRANMLSLDQAQNDAFNNSGDNIIHTCIDRNSNPTQNVDVFQRYSSYKKYSVLKPFTRAYSITYPTGVWLDCRSELVDLTLLQRLGAFGGVFAYAENIIEDNLELFNEPWASVEWEYHCVFRGKSIPTVTFGAGGVMTITPPEELPAPVGSTLINVRGGTYGTGDTDMKVHYQSDQGDGDQGVDNFDAVNPVDFTPVAP